MLRLTLFVINTIIACLLFMLIYLALWIFWSFIYSIWSLIFNNGLSLQDFLYNSIKFSMYIALPFSIMSVFWEQIMYKKLGHILLLIIVLGGL